VSEIDYSKRNDSGEYYIRAGHEGVKTFGDLSVVEVHETKYPDKFTSDIISAQVTLEGDTPLSVSEFWLIDQATNKVVGYGLLPFTTIVTPGDSIEIQFTRVIDIENGVCLST